MNLEELSIQMENAVDNLYIMWLAHEAENINHLTMSNALKATYDHLNNISQAITSIVDNYPASYIRF